jgi:hypothetical protein
MNFLLNRLFNINKNLVRVLINSRYQSTSLKHYELKTPLFKNILTPELLKLSNLFSKHDFELRICGGAVRDLYMNIEPQDIDLATNAKPGF